MPQREERLAIREHEVAKREAALAEREQDDIDDVLPEYLAEDGQAHPLKRGRDVRIAAFLKSHRGPLPAPQTLHEYEMVLPGTAERILQRMEKQSNHRMEMEKAVIGSNTFSQKWGVVGGFILAVIAIIGALYLVAQGMSLSGLTFFIGTLSSFIIAFVYGRAKQAEERQELRTTDGPNPSENPKLPSPNSPE